MKKNILLIDDEELITASLQKLLNRQGYDVVVANDVASALQEVRNADFNLVISDVRIPEVDGLEGIEKIRTLLKESNKPMIPEVLMTGYADLDKYEKAKSLNVMEYLYKPFDNAQFLATVNSILKPEEKNNDN